MRRAALALIAATAGCGTRDHRPPPLAPPPEVDLAIVGVTVVHPGQDGAAAVEPDRTVLVSHGRITAVGPSASTPPPAGARVVDGHHGWLVPGLIDAHVHFFQSADPFTRPDAADFRDIVPYVFEDVRNRARLDVTFEVYLACGITSVVDPGGPMWNFDVRDRADANPIAPRVRVAGPLISLVARPELDLGDPPIIKVTSPDEARALVARELARRPDFIKVWFIHDPKAPMAPDEAIVRATALAAHAAHVRLLVHATELDTAKAAIRAGADVLVHSVFEKPVDDDFLAQARAAGVILIPTLWVSSGYRTVLTGAFEPTAEEARLGDPEILGMMKSVPRVRTPRPLPPGPAPAMVSLPRIWAAGIPVALGTDAGNIGTLHGPSLFREARLMVEAGLTPAQVLRAATVGGAAVLGMSDQLGDVAPGRLADLVLLDADPLASVDNLARARLVVRAGRAFDPAALTADVRSR